LNRLTDSPDQLRIQQEKAAVEFIFLLIDRGRVIWVASSILETELRGNPNLRSRKSSLGMLAFAKELWLPDRNTAQRAHSLNALGYGTIDALHLAIAEDSRVDFLITTDDRFLRKIRRGLGNPRLSAANLLDWIKQVQP
jgi:hypothetical protein